MTKSRSSESLFYFRPQISRVPSRQSVRQESPVTTSKPAQKQRIRIRPPTQEKPEPVRQRQRAESPSQTSAPAQTTPRTRVVEKESKQTIQLSGIFDPSALRVFAPEPEASTPTPSSAGNVNQFQVPEISNIRRLPEPKMTKLTVTTPAPAQPASPFQIPKIRTFPEPKIVEKPLKPKAPEPKIVQKPIRTKAPEPIAQKPSRPKAPKPIVQKPLRPKVPEPVPEQPNFVPIQEIISEKEDLPLFNVEPATQPLQRPKPFVAFSAQPQQQQQPNLRPLPFQGQPAPQQQPRTQFIQPSREQPLSRQPQPLSRQPQPAPQQQPFIRQPQPIPFQTRPAPTPVPKQPVPANQDPFTDRPSLFDSFDLPSDFGGASFSYEAVVGRR